MFAAGRPLPWTCSPLEALAAWPADQPVAFLHSGRLHPRWSRYSVLAAPRGTLWFHRTHTQWVGPASPFRHSWSDDPLADLGAVTEAEPETLWLGYLAYDLARRIEQLPALAADDRSWPLLAWHRCPDYLVHDQLTQRWSAFGTWRERPPVLEPQRAWCMPFRCSDPKADLSPQAYRQRVQRSLDYIAAGDLFQVNFTQRFTARCSGSSRHLYEKLATVSPAWYGAYLEFQPPDPLAPALSLASTSPELFLQVDEAGHVLTRPIKGTRPCTPGLEPESDSARRVLQDSAKDAAELHMIVDLMRNDLGRVCRYGSMKVHEARRIESHPTVHHGVATIGGQLRSGCGLAKLLRATLPGGSITGAPKVRAMEVIEELEPTRRGPYCGGIGWIRGAQAGLNIAIRTLLREGETIDFSVGGGIVADSNPQAEYEESLHKAAALRKALSAETRAATCHGL